MLELIIRFPIPGHPRHQLPGDLRQQGLRLGHLHLRGQQRVPHPVGLGLDHGREHLGVGRVHRQPLLRQLQAHRQGRVLHQQVLRQVLLHVLHLGRSIEELLSKATNSKSKTKHRCVLILLFLQQKILYKYF